MKKGQVCERLKKAPATTTNSKSRKRAYLEEDHLGNELIENADGLLEVNEVEKTQNDSKCHLHHPKDD